ncbi:MAG: class I SAM-dependent methyltransferase [Pseudomonadota bacterium]
MRNDPDLAGAYALQTPEDNKRLYARWAESYEAGFVAENDYILHRAVAEAFTENGRGPVLDIGAGTGLCGAALRALGIAPVDGTDISAEMLEQADQKGVYRKTFAGDILVGLDVPDGTYTGIVSSGTLTHGHVGPDGLDEVVRLLAPDGQAVLSINRAHFEAQGFAAKLDSLRPDLSSTELRDVSIYGPKAAHDHAQDRATLVLMTKA